VRTRPTPARAPRFAHKLGQEAGEFSRANSYPRQCKRGRREGDPLRAPPKKLKKTHIDTVSARRSRGACAVAERYFE